jgi:hypothetical protein
MGAGLISFLFAAGAATWIYTKFQRYSGNNTQQSLMASGISGLMIFLVFFLILKLIL